MTPVHKITIIAGATLSLLAASALASGKDDHDVHHPAASAAQGVAQAQKAPQGMGISGTTPGPSGYAEQMRAMQAMHDKMLAAKTPEERNALMAEQMKLMQDGMAMMGGMGMGMGMGIGMGMGGGAMAGGNRPGADPAQPGDMASRQQMIEQRMDMMQSMMQMMMDRMAPAPASK
jgi:hypothetical protein